MKKNTVTDLSHFKNRKSSDSSGSLYLDRDVVCISENVSIGSKQICVMAGPCSVETEEQFLAISSYVAKHGAVIIRGGIFKPRTSPYSFQGLGQTGFAMLDQVRKATNCPIISEILDVRLIEQMAEHVDIFQVGARNMYNYPLLKELGDLKKPVLLKRSMMATMEEFIGAAEYLLSHGNHNVILCERGIRSFDSSTRFCLDLTAVPVLKEKLKLPIVIDPSHGTGDARYVEAMSGAAIAAGADGLLIEVHNQPEKALSDANQAIDFPTFERMMPRLKKIAHAVDRTI